MADQVRCPGHARHWFTPYGRVGLRAPACIRCGAPNPRPLTLDERAEWDYAVRQGWVRDPADKASAGGGS